LVRVAKAHLWQGTAGDRTGSRGFGQDGVGLVRVEEGDLEWLFWGRTAGRTAWWRDGMLVGTGPAEECFCGRGALEATVWAEEAVVEDGVSEPFLEVDEGDGLAAADGAEAAGDGAESFIELLCRELASLIGHEEAWLAVATAGTRQESRDVTCSRLARDDFHRERHAREGVDHARDAEAPEAEERLDLRPGTRERWVA
jgi:hypothetical protein